MPIPPLIVTVGPKDPRSLPARLWSDRFPLAFPFENLNHRQRDCVYDEDACLTRTGHGPANRASLNNIALAVVFANRRESEILAENRRRLQLNRSEAIAALTRP